MLFLIEVKVNKMNNKNISYDSCYEHQKKLREEPFNYKKRIREARYRQMKRDNKKKRLINEDMLQTCEIKGNLSESELESEYEPKSLLTVSNKVNKATTHISNRNSHTKNETVELNSDKSNPCCYVNGCAGRCGDVEVVKTVQLISFLADVRFCKLI